MDRYKKLRQFITEEMRMSQVYQPVMLVELLKNNGEATVQQIAQAILDKDPTQIEYFSDIVKNMVGQVLTKNRGITEKDGSTYKLIGSQDLSQEQVDELVSLCEQRIQDFERQRGEAVWEHRKRGHRPISGSIRYEVLSRAKFKCELCGISADEKNIEVDHIFPKSLGGKDDLSNFQALCYSCNAAKRNTDDTDFRLFKSLYEHREEKCLFCDIQTNDRKRIIAENSLAYAIRDGFAVTEGHTLFIPKRHVVDYFGLVPAEVNAINSLMAEQKKLLQEQDTTIDGFNIGMNCGETAGQTIFHCHVHLIPRRKGDVENPRGGVRHIIAGKGFYEEKKMKVRKFISLIALFSSAAYATVETGNSFLEEMQSGNSMQRQFLMGYTAGLYDAYERLDPSIAKCLGTNVKMSQLVDAIEIYLKSNPQIRHHAMQDIFPSAIKRTFNCK